VGKPYHIVSKGISEKLGEVLKEELDITPIGFQVDMERSSCHKISQFIFFGGWLTALLGQLRF
jgi:hypothetical protein